MTSPEAIRRTFSIIDTLPIEARVFFNMYPGYWYVVMLSDNAAFDFSGIFDLTPQTPSLDFVDGITPYPVSFGFDDEFQVLDFLAQVQHALR